MPSNHKPSPKPVLTEFYYKNNIILKCPHEITHYGIVMATWIWVNISSDDRFLSNDIKTWQSSEGNFTKGRIMINH